LRAYVAQIDAKLAALDQLPVTPEFRAAWMQDKRVAARVVFDKYNAPDFTEAGVTNLDDAFTKWFDAQVAKQDPAKLNADIANDLHAMAKEEKLKTEAPSRANFDQARADLDGS